MDRAGGVQGFGNMEEGKMESEMFSHFPPPKSPRLSQRKMEQSQCWEDAIDVDDSDLPSLFNRPTTSKPPSLPSLHPCSNLPNPSQTLDPNPAPAPAPQPLPEQTSTSFRPIPGPAGAVQFALHRKSAMLAHPPWRASPLATNDLVANMEEDDRDFKLDPWLCALRFLGLGPNSAQPVPICSVKARGDPAERIPQVMGIVTSCVPNGLGDLFITLKDPTGDISASVHHKVFLESNLGGDITVGCVLILKQVAVFWAGRSSCYLNVTLSNVVKVISKDCGPPSKQVLPSQSARCGAYKEFQGTGQGAAKGASSGKRIAEGLHMGAGVGEENTSLSGQRVERAADGIRRTLNSAKMINNKKMGLTGSFLINREDVEVGIWAPQRVPLVVGARTEAISDEAGRNLIYGEHVRIDGDSEERRHSARLIAETISGEMSRNLSCEKTNTLKTGLVGVLNRFSSTASTANVPVLGTTRDNMETEPSGTQRALSQRERVNLSAEDITRSLPCNSIAMTAGLDCNSEPKNLISKDLLGQWTDEQLQELFADY